MKEEENIDFNSPITDLMTSLMVIFILLLVVALNNIGGKGARTVDSLAKKMSSENSVENIKIIKSNDDPLSLSVLADESTGVKFASNRADITPDGRKKLTEIYDMILEHTCDPKNYEKIDSIQIIGHTDKNTVRKDPKFGNLSLSQDRALSVLKFGLNHVGIDSDKGKCLLELASINGRGMAELQATDAESRRVEFKIRVKSFEQAKKIKNEFTKLSL